MQSRCRRLLRSGGDRGGPRVASGPADEDAPAAHGNRPARGHTDAPHRAGSADDGGARLQGRPRRDRYVVDVSNNSAIAFLLAQALPRQSLVGARITGGEAHGAGLQPLPVGDVNGRATAIPTMNLRDGRCCSISASRCRASS